MASMRWVGASGLVLMLVVGACEQRDPYDPSNPPQPGYQPQPGYPAQPGHPPPAPTNPPTPPGPLALPCSNDSTCGTHRCNTQYGRCAMPCSLPADCLGGMTCVLGACLPGGAPP